VISTTLAPRITNAQKMNEWRTPAYHSRATLRWKIPYTMKFLIRVGMWSHRRSCPFPRNRYRIRRYSFRPKIDSETTRKRVAAYVSRALSTMRILGKAPSLHQPAVGVCRRAARFLPDPVPDAARHARDLGFRIDFVVRPLRDLRNFGVGSDDHQDDLGEC